MHFEIFEHSSGMLNINEIVLEIKVGVRQFKNY